MRTPLVPKVSLRCMAAKIASRVFSSAHTPPRSDVASNAGSRPASFFPLKRICGVASVSPCPPKKFDSVYGTAVLSGHSEISSQEQHGDEPSSALVDGTTELIIVWR